MATITDQSFTGERPLYGTEDSIIDSCRFGEGESPLKECRRIKVADSFFGWKYPLWYCRDVEVAGTTWEQTARAGVWYSQNIKVTDSVIHAPKSFRRCVNLTVSDTEFTDAAETLWNCTDLMLDNIKVRGGDYLAMNSRNIEVNRLDLEGNYAFDGCSDAVVRNSRLITKDAFWNCRNVTVYDSYISGEYLGWNSGNLSFVNCTIESSQGLCYINDLRMKNCRLINTTLAFEYSKVEADISSDIDSILNPGQGTITCGRIGELIIEKDRVDPGRTVIKAASIAKESSRPEWLL